MRWTEHRQVTALMGVIAVITTVIAATQHNHIYTFLSGASCGTVLLMALLCWRWKI